jgi:2-oxoglutarate/2-oxoacid ferredoxin oxidoreductase subunit beta
MCGYPMRMAEMLSTLRTPAYIERVAVHTPQNIVRAKKAIRKEFQYQIDNKCFSLVEVLSTCPSNWGLTPNEALKWLETMMAPYYPLGCFKTPENEV